LIDDLVPQLCVIIDAFCIWISLTELSGVSTDEVLISKFSHEKEKDANIKRTVIHPAIKTTRIFWRIFIIG
jgi:hypothetical protein